MSAVTGNFRSKTFNGIPIASLTADEAVSEVLHATDRDATTFRLINAGTLYAATSITGYSDLLSGVGVNLPDGRPLAAVLRRLAPSEIPCEQIRGPWLFEACLDRGRHTGTKHFFLGSTDETLTRLVDEVRRRFPGTLIAGTYAPPFGARSEDEVKRQDGLLLTSGADIVWVALGTPKQDGEALRILRTTGITTVAVGAAFDFTARTKRSAPPWLRSLHLEWLFRLICEPRRLARRYLVGNSKFLLMAIRQLRQAQ